MLDTPIARGKKQRIKKKIQTLKNPEEAAKAKSEKSKKTKEDANISAKQRVEQLLRKRDEKMQKKEDKKSGKAYIQPEDKEIMKV